MTTTVLKVDANYYADIMDDHKDYKTFKSTFAKLKNVGLYIITIKEIISLANNGMLDYYEKNRGYRGITEKHVQKIVNEFDYNSLGIISMTFNKKNKRLMTVDGSHRMAALCQLAADDKIDMYWDYEIVVKVVEKADFLTTYQNINSGIAHTKGNTLTNTDLAYGKLISQLDEQAMLDSGLKIPFPRRNYNVLAFCLYSLSKHRENTEAWIEDWSYEHVWAKYRKGAAKDTKSPTPEIHKLKMNNCGNLVNGVIVALQYLEELEKRRKAFEAVLRKDIPDQFARKRTLKDNYPPVLYNDTIIGYLVCAGSRKIYKLEDVDCAVTQIMKRSTKLANMINRGHAKTLDKFSISLYLDRAIFGDQVKAQDLNYVINAE